MACTANCGPMTSGGGLCSVNAGHAYHYMVGPSKSGTSAPDSPGFSVPLPVPGFWGDAAIIAHGSISTASVIGGGYKFSFP